MITKSFLKIQIRQYKTVFYGKHHNIIIKNKEPLSKKQHHIKKSTKPWNVFLSIMCLLTWKIVRFKVVCILLLISLKYSVQPPLSDNIDPKYLNLLQRERGIECKFYKPYFNRFWGFLSYWSCNEYTIFKRRPTVEKLVLKSSFVTKIAIKESFNINLYT